MLPDVLAILLAESLKLLSEGIGLEGSKYLVSPWDCCLDGDEETEDDDDDGEAARV